MSKPVLSKKVLVLGVDGLDPRFSRKMLREGKMPNLQKIIDRGSCREDLVMLGGHPTVTPPMWTTLSTGCYANVHGITDFNRQSPTRLDAYRYNLHSSFCKAEQVWNVLCEAGYKTLVWHWPGCAWPPTSDSDNLYVVDGSTPGALGLGAMQREVEYIVGASEKTETLRFIPKAASNVVEPCIITDLKVDTGDASGEAAIAKNMLANNDDDKVVIILDRTEGHGKAHNDVPIDVVQSPIKPASGWSIEVPEGAKEMTILFSAGYIHRPCLILKNDEGIYDTIQIFKSKKANAPSATMKKGVMLTGYVDECIKDDKKLEVSRYLKILDMEPDGSKLRIWVSAAVEMGVDTVFHPRRLYHEIVEKFGPIPPNSAVSNHDKGLVTDATWDCWNHNIEWTGKSMNYVIDKEGIDVVFSHMHNIDIQSHKIIRFMTDKGHNVLEEKDYVKFMEDLYTQTDDYFGHFVDRLDQGWTIMVLSDHAQVCPTYDGAEIGDAVGVNIGLMNELGLTVMVKDENGNDTHDIDWSKTIAVASKCNHIYLNLKGRWDTGIVDPEDQFEVEEEIMTRLYGYKHPVTGKRIIAIALRNRDAVLLGQGGPEAGDIIVWVAEGYNQDHGDTLSTALGEAETSVSPIFVAAGPGIKEGYKTERIIRQVDVVPTICTLLGTRMPAQCEGAPVYQIFDREV